MPSNRHHHTQFALGDRKIALLPVAQDAFLHVEMSAGCEQFIGRYARIDAFRYGTGIIRFRACAI